MKSKISFLLNNDLIEVEIHPATVVLDFIRSQRLTGTKEGCKEGDCGACTVLIGEIVNGEVNYRTVNSCLLPLQNIQGKHVVTIEGLNPEGKNLNPIQQAFLEEGASQCGFCTPGFVMSFTEYLINGNEYCDRQPLDSIDGNICRCTGHNSIIRAIEKISAAFKDMLNTKPGLKELIDKKIIPEYFSAIQQRLTKITETETNGFENGNNPKYYISGGTDLFVQKPFEMLNSSVNFLNNKKELTTIEIQSGYCCAGSGCTVTDLLESDIINSIFPDMYKFAELFGSTPIRNSATLGGNLMNASPIGDMTAFFMALNSNVVLGDGQNTREIPLNKFYKAYKVTNIQPGEILKSVSFKIPQGNYFFNFEKVSKRTYLDIASVNTTILLTIDNLFITDIHISAGGVAATPVYLFQTCEFLKDKELNCKNICEAANILQKEISPISDARGSGDYKRMLLARLVFTHFLTLFPEIINIEETV